MSKRKEVDLNLCLHCGGKGKVVSSLYGLEWVHCTRCGADGGESFYRAVAVRKWNQRAGEKT